MYWFAYPVFYTMFVTVVTLREIGNQLQRAARNVRCRRTIIALGLSIKFSI